VKYTIVQGPASTHILCQIINEIFKDFMSKKKVFQWILYFPSQKNIVLKKNWYFFSFLENFKFSTNNLFSVEAALVCMYCGTILMSNAVLGKVD
jgi:hypothetical protein